MLRCQMALTRLPALLVLWSLISLAGCGDSSAGGADGGSTKAFVSSVTPDRPSGSAVYVNNPIHVTFGATSIGAEKDVLVTLGLMEKPSDGATDADLQDLKSCILQGAEIHLRGDGSEQLTDFDAVIPPECLDGGLERTFNYQLIVDLVEDKTGQDPKEKILVFNQREQADPINQKCHMLDVTSGADELGCVDDLLVKPTPGLDVALISAEPSASVVVVYPPTEDANVPAGASETPRGALSIKTALRAFGQDESDATAGVLPSPVNLTYEVLAQPDNTSVGWMPLGVNPDSMVMSVSALRPGQTISANANMMLTPALRTLVTPGGAWYGLDTFLVRVCAAVPFDEQGDPLLAGSDGRSDNCKSFPIRLVRATTAPSLANAYNADKDYAVSWGSKDSIEADFAASSHNDLDLAGATSDQQISLGIDGLFGKFSAFEAWGTASATVTPASASLDTGVKMFGRKFFTHTDQGAAISYDQDVNFSKEQCQHYVFAALIVPVEVSFCVSGTAGIFLSTTLSPTSLAPSVRPYAGLDASASATLGDAGFRVSLQCDANILGINSNSGDGTTANLGLGVAGLAPLSLNASVNVKSGLSISTLDIDFQLVMEAQTPDICKKKIAGVKVKYPCFKWNTVERYTIATFNGFSYKYALLDRTFASTLQ